MNAQPKEIEKPRPIRTEPYAEIVGVEQPEEHYDERPSVDASTLGMADREKLIQEALQEAKAVTTLIDKSEEEADHLGRELIRRMLLVRESFEVDDIFDEAAFRAYVDEKLGAVRGRVKNPSQRLARLCMPKETNRSLISKYGYVLAALEKRGIHSGSVLAELEKREPVKNDGPEYGGLERFVRLHKQDVQPEGGTETSKTLFESWSKERLAKNAMAFFQALHNHNLLSGKIKRIEDILSEELILKKP